MKEEHPEKLARTAVEKFQKMYNCCQSVACSVCEEYGISEKDMFRLTEGFGSGIGGLKDTCGAAMGMFLIISLPEAQEIWSSLCLQNLRHMTGSGRLLKSFRKSAVHFTAGI